MPSSVVCDAGGVLAVAGVLKGTVQVDAEFLALDWSTMTIGRFVAIRHEGNPERIQVEMGLALAVVHEWFPVRILVTETLSRAGQGAVDALDSWSALILAETLDLPLFTASDEVSSSRIEIRRPW